MRVLIMGGTVFLSRAVAEVAVRRGHEVVCAARGESGAVPPGARLVPVDRDTPDGLAALAGQRFDAAAGGRVFDAVVDVASMSVSWVRAALRAVGAGARHWTFVSTGSVYADHSRPGTTELLPPLEDDPAAGRDPERYGGVKVASEDAVRAEVGDRAFVVRAGLITGPGDRSDRFGYWPARFARGGRVLVPDAPDQAAQHVDVRDLAEWIVTAGEQRLTGTFDAVGPITPLPDLLAEVRAAVADQVTDQWAASDVTVVPVGSAELVAAGVAPWSGPRSLPLWLPDGEHAAMMARDPGPARAAGLVTRPVADTAVAALAHERALGLDRPRRAGLTPAEEADLLAALA
jgi:nucleoside-diphosphate-sugar epimerase